MGPLEPFEKMLGVIQLRDIIPDERFPGIHVLSVYGCVY